MHFRQATLNDIPQIQVVRNSVKENMLYDAALVSDIDCEEFITRRGRGWVCTMDEQVVGFAIADLQEDNIWALFVHPAHEGKGIGKRLYQLMLDWYFAQGKTTVWLGTAPGTRAATFYKNAGLQQTCMHGSKEIIFEMTGEEWLKAKVTQMK